MSDTANVNRAKIRTISAEGKRVHVHLRITHDGVEHVGRLCFLVDGGAQREVCDRAALPGRTAEEVEARADRLSDAELEQRFQRGRAERRRYRELRRTTNDILAEIRRLNETTISLRAGLIDTGIAAQEVLAAEARLHALINGLRAVAGTGKGE